MESLKGIVLIGVISFVCCNPDAQYIRINSSKSISVPTKYAIFRAGVVLGGTDVRKLDSIAHSKLVSVMQVFKHFEIEEYYTDESAVNQNYDNPTVHTLSQSYTARINDLQKLDGIRRALLSNGCNTFLILKYGNDSLESYERKLRQLVIQSAKEKANDISKTSSISIKLGKIVKIIETADYYRDAMEDNPEFEDRLNSTSNIGVMAAPNVGMESYSLEPTIVRKTFEINSQLTILFEIE